MGLLYEEAKATYNVCHKKPYMAAMIPCNFKNQRRNVMQVATDYRVIILVRGKSTFSTRHRLDNSWMIASHQG